MPNIAPKNYLAKIDEVLAHWTQVNAALSSNVVLQNGYSFSNMSTDRTNLAAQIAVVIADINAVEFAIADRDTKRAAMKERMRQFNMLVRGSFPRGTYENMLPKIPDIKASQGVWMKAMSDMNNVWTLINAISPVPTGAPVPLVLTGSYTLALFIVDQTALNTAFTAIETTTSVLETAIKQRDFQWNSIFQRMRQYRLNVQGRFAAGAPLLASLPSITPPAGHTPTAVNVSAMWDAGLSKAVITYTSSSDSDLQEYELRGSIGGTKYNADTASVLGSHLAGDTTAFQTDDGLVASGSRVFYKVYVVLTTGNEKGSKTVNVIRP